MEILLKINITMKKYYNDTCKVIGIILILKVQ